MIYLSGGHPRLVLGLREDLGVLITPRMGQRLDLRGTWWGADTGCYSAKESRAFSLEEYLAFLDERRVYALRCLFATAPDVIGDAAATWERSRDVLPRIRQLGYRAALVAQDGLEGMDVDWDAIDCLFVGGSTAWKLSEAAYRLVAQARERGEWAHMGRVNGWDRIKAAALSGYDSADGTKLAFGPDANLPYVMGWLDQLQKQPKLRELVA